MQFSRFNIIKKYNEKFLIYNTLNASIVELTKNEFKQIKKDVKKNNSSSLVQALKKQDIIIEQDNELDIINFNYKCMQHDKLNLSMTICPTLECNFCCSYCFEKRIPGIMTKENQNKLIKFVKENIKNYKSMDVLWFGGEPLMGWSVIENLSKNFIEICKENNIPYTAYIISNAFLLDDKKAIKFEEYKINGIQITIDGPKKIHDTRRVLKNNKGTYDTILKNIKNLEKYKLRVHIRVNIDKTNNQDIEELFKDFNDKGLNFVKFDFGHIIDYTENCKSIACNCLTKQQFSETIKNYKRILKTYNFEKNLKEHIPEPISVFCDAQKMYAYNIDHELNRYKCWNEMSDITKSIGKLASTNRTEEQRAHERKYMLDSPLHSKKCRKCKYLPLCFGGCPYLKLKTGKNQCEKWMFIIDNVIEEYVKQNEL